MGVAINSTDFLQALNSTSGFFAGYSYPFNLVGWLRRADYDTGPIIAYGVGLNRGNANAHYFGLGLRRGAVTPSEGRGHGVRAAAATPMEANGTDNDAPENVWTLLVATFNDATTGTLYTNGSGTSDSFGSTSTTPTGIDSISLGSEIITTADTIDVAEVAIIDGAALATSEIDALFTTIASAVDLSTSGATLQHYWPLNGDFEDKVGGVDLTESGSVASTDTHPSLSGGASSAQVVVSNPMRRYRKSGRFL